MVVFEAEIKFGYFLGELHLVFRLTDHDTKLFASMFHDSEIAKGFKCGHTTATAILKVIAHDAWRCKTTALEESKYFSIQTEETTDISVTQQIAITYLCFDFFYNILSLNRGLGLYFLPGPIRPGL